MANSALALIPARSGSKRIPHKNIRDFLGFPIIKYPIESAIQSGCFDEVMVSTDDHKIADIARSFGASVPFLRSPISSSDLASTADVILEVLEEYKKIGKDFSFICCIYPTSVFVTPALFNQAKNMLSQDLISSVAVVTPSTQPIERSFRIADNLLLPNNPRYLNTRTQDLPMSYFDSGQLYFLKKDFFLKEKTVFLKHTVPIIIKPSDTQDIDNVDDWDLAELKYQLFMKKGLK